MSERLPDRAMRVRSYFDSLLAADKTPGVQYLVLDFSGMVFEYVGFDVTGCLNAADRQFFD